MGHVLKMRTQGADEVEEVWQRFVPSARIDRLDPRTVSFAWNSVGLKGFSVVAWEFTASTTASINMNDQMMACRMVGDDLHTRTGRDQIDQRRPWLGLDAPITAEWTGTAKVRAFVFDRTEAQRFARTAAGDDRLVLRRLDPSARDRESAARWERCFSYVSASLAVSHDEPIVAAELQRHALMTTLTSFGTSYLDGVERAHQRTAAPRTVRRAVAYIEAHAHEPITLDDIALAAGISTRGLQHAFRRDLDATPSEYLRRVRLAGAREELRSEAAVSVRDVARRWGFTSPSRFARYYRENYGENPAQTARMF